jgi:predicted esterase
LDQLGVIFVSAARSGNDQDVLLRREPLALLAFDNVAARYPVDPDRVFIGGFSGGSKVAERLALAFPDIFHGVLLNAGADVIGAAPYMMPAQALLSPLQNTTRIAYVVGRHDEINISESDESAQSMVGHCIYNVQAFTMPRAGHDIATPASLSESLAYLSQSSPPNLERLSGCRKKWSIDVARRVGFVEALIATDKKDAARAMIYKLDAEFGGLAGRQAIDLADKCSCKIFE